MSGFTGFLLVFLGGGLGSLCRYGIALGMQGWHLRFPWATLLANGLACFVLGLVLGSHTQGLLSDQRRLLLATGFCGGFSTFSTFSAEAWSLWQNGQNGMTMIYVASSLAGSLACLLLGLKIAA